MPRMDAQNMMVISIMMNVMMMLVMMMKKIMMISSINVWCVLYEELRRVQFSVVCNLRVSRDLPFYCFLMID